MYIFFGRKKRNELSHLHSQQQHRRRHHHHHYYNQNHNQQKKKTNHRKWKMSLAVDNNV